MNGSVMHDASVHPARIDFPMAMSSGFVHSSSLPLFPPGLSNQSGTDLPTLHVILGEPRPTSTTLLSA